jgi:hypothetical protein
VIPLPRSVRIVALLTAAAGLLVALEFLPTPEDTLFWDALYNAGHAPLFGAFALTVLALGVAFTGGTGRARVRLYLVSLAAAAAAGLLTEVVQFYGPRDADLLDALRNLAGTVAFLLFAATFDRTLAGTAASPLVRRPRTPRVAALVLLAVVLAPVAVSVAAYRARDASFPILYGFETFTEKLFIRTSGASLTRELLPERFAGERQGYAGHASFYFYDYPLIDFREPCPDWTGYRRLTFTIYSELDDTVPLALFIDDELHHRKGKQRYLQRLSVHPGINRIDLPLSAMEEIDLTRVRRMDLYAIRPERTFSLWIDTIRLE